MHNLLTSVFKPRRVAAVALALAVVPCVAGTASAAPKSKRATWTKSAASSAPTSTAPTVSSVHSIGGYVFYNVTYSEAVELWLAAVAAAPAGYTPPPVYSVSATTTVSGTVTDGGN